MRFTLSKKNINKIIAYCKVFCDPKSSFESCKVAHCYLKNGILTVFMTDGFLCSQLLLEVENRNGDDFEGNAVLSFPSCKFIYDFVTVECTDFYTLYIYGDGKEMQVPIPSSLVPFNESLFTRYFSPVVQSIYIDSEKLCSALKPFGRSAVRLDICSSKYSPGIAITKNGERAFVWPLRAKSEEKVNFK